MNFWFILENFDGKIAYFGQFKTFFWPNNLKSKVWCLQCLYFVVMYAKKPIWCYIQVKINYSSKTYFLDNIGNIGANLGAFLAVKPPKMKVFKKLFLNLHLGPKWHLKRGEPAKFADSPLYPLPLDLAGWSSFTSKIFFAFWGNALIVFIVITVFVLKSEEICRTS